MRQHAEAINVIRIIESCETEQQLRITQSFNIIWIRMVGEGWCQVFGGHEYRRVLSDYLTNGNNREIEEFIKCRV